MAVDEETLEGEICVANIRPVCVGLFDYESPLLLPDTSRDSLLREGCENDCELCTLGRHERMNEWTQPE